jgi:hypothetical protein
MLVLHSEWLALYGPFSSSVGVKFAQSSSQWEARAKTRRDLLNPADQCFVNMKTFSQFLHGSYGSTLSLHGLWSAFGQSIDYCIHYRTFIIQGYP